MSRKVELLKKAAIYLADLNAFDLIAEIEAELAKPEQDPLTEDQMKKTAGYQNANFNGINAVVWFKRGFKQAEKSYGIGALE